MDELEFQRILNLFPVVRRRDYCYHADSASSRQLLAQPTQNKKLQDVYDGKDKRSTSNKLNQQDAFWGKLKMAAEEKIGAAEAERFCETFQRIYNKLVYEALSLDAAQEFLEFIEQ